MVQLYRHSVSGFVGVTYMLSVVARYTDRGCLSNGVVEEPSWLAVAFWYELGFLEADDGVADSRGKRCDQSL